MKHLTLIAVAVLAPWIACAQSSGTVNGAVGGAVVGGVVGGVIGNNNGHHTGEGIAIGAGVGLVTGAIIGNAYDRNHPQPPPPPPAQVVVVQGPVAYTQVPYAPVPPAPRYRPNYVVAGALMGGVAGGIIGNNSHHQTWEGVAIGAGAGMLLGAVAESNARYRERMRHERWAAMNPTMVTTTVTTQPAVVTTQTPAPIAAPAPQPANNNMAAANSLFGR